MQTKRMGQNLIRYQVTDSTNVDAAKAAADGASEGTLIIAESQRAGRGRKGRSWTSPEGCNLYFSLLLRPEYKPDQACMVTLVMALAVAEAIAGLGIDAKIKWPNDVVVSGKKVCGILTEMSLSGDRIAHVIIGTGINVNQTEFPEEIRQTADSLKNRAGNDVDREKLLSRVMEEFEKYYDVFVENGDLSGLMKKYESRLVNRNTAVRVLDPGGEFEGTARGINWYGELIVERENGIVENIYAGEVSVRGVYGYV